MVFKDISVIGRVAPPSHLHGFDAEHTVKGVTFQNVRFDNQPILDAGPMRLTIGPHVTAVRYAPTDREGK